MLRYFVLVFAHCIQRLSHTLVFDLRCVVTLIAKIEVSGSPVTVTVDSVTSGSVKDATTVAFLSGDSSSASTYTYAKKWQRSQRF